MELTCDSVVQSAISFHFLLLVPVVEGESVAETAPVAASSGAVLCRDSMKLRISEIEDLLGVQQFAFMRASRCAAIPLKVSLYRDELGLRVEKTDFTLVREPDRRRYGVLLRVTTVVLKRQILAGKGTFQLRGYFEDFNLVRVSVCDPQNCSCFKNLSRFYCLLALISSHLLVSLFSEIHGRPRRQLRCRPRLFLA